MQRSQAALLAQDAGLSRPSAAPAGGALKRGRGCTTFLASALIALAGPAVALEDPIELPSGRVVEFQELRFEVSESDDALLRFRFVSDELAETELDLERLSADMDHLCSEIALPSVPGEYPDPNRIVISIGSEATEFGVSRPDIVQVFEAYSIEDDRCIWEAF